MSRTVIHLSFDDHSTYEADGIQDARDHMDELGANYMSRLIRIQTENGDDYRAVMAYRTLLLTTFGGDTHE